MVTIYNPYFQLVYIVVDTILYLYTLPIDLFLFPYPNLCLSCNLSQAKSHNRPILFTLDKLKDSIQALLLLTLLNLFSHSIINSYQ